MHLPDDGVPAYLNADTRTPRMCNILSQSVQISTQFLNQQSSMREELMVRNWVTEKSDIGYGVLRAEVAEVTSCAVA
jgi:hypothetical protein